MNSHLAKLVAGFKALANGQTDYIYEYSESKAYNCKIGELFTDQLHHRFPHINEKIVAEDFDDCLSLPGELMGRKSPEVAISSSKNLCIKMIDNETLQKMEQIFTDILSFKDKNEETYIIDIYRVYRVQSKREKYSRIDLYILMPSLRRSFDEIISVFDIKGYVDSGRSLSPEQFRVFKFGKDQNFISSKQLSLILKIPIKQRMRMIENMAQTVKFLEERHLIDYSLLICFRNNPQGEENIHIKNIFKIGKGIWMEWEIIDYFQQFNIKKRMQMKMKTLFKKQVSSAEPEVYSKRFIDFLKKYLLGDQ